MYLCSFSGADIKFHRLGILNKRMLFSDSSKSKLKVCGSVVSSWFLSLVCRYLPVPYALHGLFPLHVSVSSSCLLIWTPVILD